jgi:antitoxin component of RelBE/YafQ-DinJ toxin-antitoxin module
MRMKTKLTLSIDKKLIPESKKFARRYGKSVSQLVEELLNEKINKNNIGFSKKWLGKFEVAEKEDLRYKKLQDRYSL